MAIAEKLQLIYDSVEDVRDAIQEWDEGLGRGTIDTLGDDIRSLLAGGNGYTVKVYEDSESVSGSGSGSGSGEPTRVLIFQSVLSAKGDDLNTDVIDGLGELDGDMIDLADGFVEIPLNTGVHVVVKAANVFVNFKDPLVESIVTSTWGTNNKITLAVVRALSSLGDNFKGTAIETFNELKWFDGLTAWGRLDYFNGCTSLREIKIPRCTSIGDSPFYGCSLLTSLVLPDTLDNIGTGYNYQKGFIAGTAIEELVIPPSVTKSDSECFLNTSSLKHLVWGDNLAFPRAYNQGNYNEQRFDGCTNLEKIDNLPATFVGNVPTRFNNCSKLDFSNITDKLTAVIDDTWHGTAKSYFNGTHVFDGATNGIVTCPCLLSNTNGDHDRYVFNSDSELGHILNLPNFTVNPTCMGDNKAGIIVFSENVTTIGDFARTTSCGAYILPCTTPPTLSTSTFNGTTAARIYVPAASLSAYQSAENWSSFPDIIRAQKDTSTAQFCSIPTTAPVPTDYTKVEYISNINGSGCDNCQISNIGYQAKQYTQLLFDFEHKCVASKSNSESYSCLFNTSSNNNDYIFTIGNSLTEGWPVIFRLTSTNANYPNPMGIVQNQRFTFNSKVTGEAFGKRSTLKIAHSFLQYHGYTWQKDEETGDSNQNIMFLRYSNNETIGRQIKIYRLCFYEPAANCNDYNDPTQYELVKDYIPVMRNSDSKYGLYERIGGTFYPSTMDAFHGPTN